jgi:hypothetical protein
MPRVLRWCLATTRVGARTRKVRCQARYVCPTGRMCSVQRARWTTCREVVLGASVACPEVPRRSCISRCLVAGAFLVCSEVWIRCVLGMRQWFQVSSPRQTRPLLLRILRRFPQPFQLRHPRRFHPSPQPPTLLRLPPRLPPPLLRWFPPRVQHQLQLRIPPLLPLWHPRRFHPSPQPPTLLRLPQPLLRRFPPRVQQPCRQHLRRHHRQQVRRRILLLLRHK